jgi:hypothetical protein
MLLRYPGFELIKRIGFPSGLGPTPAKGAPVADHYYAFLGQPDRKLYRIGPLDWKWKLVANKWMGEDTGYLGAFQNKYICGVSVGGIAYRMDLATRKTSTTDLESAGKMEVHAMAVGAERTLIVGAPFINSRFWTIDMTTGQGQDQGRGQPGGGQINQIVWDAGRHRALMSSYTSAAVTEYNPDEPSRWPRNPRLVASALSENQMRPWSSVFDRRAVWMATGAQYGQLGGAISRIDVESQKIKVWRNIVPDQTINALVLDLKRRRLFFSSHIYADSDSAPPTQTTAEVGVINIDTQKLLRRQPFKQNVPTIGVVLLMPDGKVLVHIGPEYYSWDAGTGATESLGKIEGTLRSAVTDDDGTMYLCIGDAIGRVGLADGKIQFSKLLPGRARIMQITNGNLYFSVGLEIHEVPLVELR